MNEVIRRIVDEIERKSRDVQMDFGNDKWRKSIPSEPGWYWIQTDTPIDILRSVGSPKHEAHINIPKTIEQTSKLRGISIIQSEKKDYVVYNGEANNLKARAKEHNQGHSKTFCLGLSDYKELRNYHWTFSYMSDPNADKLLRLAVEQAWRTINGWPILCKK